METIEPSPNTHSHGPQAALSDRMIEVRELIANAGPLDTLTIASKLRISRERAISTLGLMVERCILRKLTKGVCSSPSVWALRCHKITTLNQ